MRILCLLSLGLAGCCTPEIIEKPVPVEVEVIKYIPIPADLTQPTSPHAIPDTMTYGAAIEMWSKDRAVIEALNARLIEIAELDKNE